MITRAPVRPSSLAAIQLTRRALVLSTGVATLTASGALSSVSSPLSARALMAIAQDTLVITDNLTAHWRTLDPAWFYEGNPSSAMYLVYEQLYHIPDGTKPTEILPLVASAMPAFSDDGLTATVPIRQDVTFHHTGNNLTAADVVFSFNRLKNVGFNGSFLASDYWTAIEALDEYTLQFTLSSPYAALPALLSAVMLSITDKAAVEAAGGTDAAPSTDDEKAPEIQANMSAKDFLDRNSAGSGPFMIKSWDLNGEVWIERNPDYWGERPAIQQVIWRNTLDPNAQLQAVQIGEADIASAVNAEEVSGVETDASLQLLEGSSLALQFLAFNMREEWGGPLLNQKVRLAIAHAVDYQGIIDGLLLGRAQRPATVVALPLEGSETILPEAFLTDLGEAQRLWDESGAGEATIELTYGSDATGRGGMNLTTLATKIQSDLQKITGLTVKLAPVPNSQRATLYRQGEYQAIIGSWLPDFPGVDSFTTPFFRTGASTARRTGYSDPEMDAMLDEAAAEQEPENRVALYAAIQRKGQLEAPYVLLYQPNDIKVASAEVQGAQVHPAYSLQLRSVRKTG